VKDLTIFDDTEMNVILARFVIELATECVGDEFPLNKALRLTLSSPSFSVSDLKLILENSPSFFIATLYFSLTSWESKVASYGSEEFTLGLLVLQLTIKPKAAKAVPTSFLFIILISFSFIKQWGSIFYW
jgi:hypothetical protein